MTEAKEILRKHLDSKKNSGAEYNYKNVLEAVLAAMQEYAEAYAKPAVETLEEIRRKLDGINDIIN